MKALSSVGHSTDRYRILGTERGYAIQRNGWFGWRTLKNDDEEGPPTYFDTPFEAVKLIGYWRPDLAGMVCRVIDRVKEE